MPVARTACHCLLCHGVDEPDRRTRMTVEDVQEHGWQVMMIPGDEYGPSRAFTIGLWHNHRSPELAMFGLDIYDMQTCLNDLGRKAIAGEALGPTRNGTSRTSLSPSSLNLRSRG